MRNVTSGITFMIIVAICSGHNAEGPPPLPLTIGNRGPPPLPLTIGNRGPVQDPSSTQKDNHVPPMMIMRENTNVYEGFQAGRRRHLVDIKEKKLPGESSEAPAEGFATEEGSNEGLVERALEGVLPDPLWSAFHSQVLHRDIREDQNISASELIMKTLGMFYLPNDNVSNNTDCIADLDILYNPTPKQALSVALLVDSWGKFPDGFLAGNTVVFGSFDECTKIDFLRNESHPSHGSIRGQYCTLKYMPINSTKENVATMPNKTTVIKIINVLTQLYLYGTCIPASCTDEDLSVSVAHFLRILELDISSVTCQPPDENLFEFNAGGITMIILLSVGGILILGSGILDAWIYHTGKDELRKGPLKYLLVFSIYTNLEKMFRINTSENKETISCFHGIRVLSMSWVVMGHQYGFRSSVNTNEFYLLDFFNGNIAIQIVLNAFPSVDTFFFMSGFLVAYVVFREQDRSGNFNIILFYVHRFLRLSPPIMLFCGFLATFQRLLVRGPVASEVVPYSMEVCQKYWYRDAFFMNNFNLDKSMCLGVTWYTSTDTQLYLVTPIFLLPFIIKQLSEYKVFKRVDLGTVWLSILTLVSVIIPLIIITTQHLPPSTVQGRTDNNYIYGTEVYLKPWCRASPFLVGIWLAYIFRLTNKEKIHLQMWQVIVGWVIATGLGIAIVFGMYNYNQIGDKIEYNWAASAFYGSLQRLLWGVAVAWVVFACHYGYGGPVNTFLSHPSWQPLSRLTYCMFLVAIPIQQMVFIFSMMVVPYFSHLQTIMEVVGVLFLSGIGGIILSLYTEGPILGLERHLLKK